MSEDFKNYPTLSQVKQSIMRLKKTGFPSFKVNDNVVEYVEEISNILTKEFQILPNVLNFIKPADFKLKIFRAREFDSIQNINLFSEHSYPPINVTGMGRCNFPKYPVFHCSNDPITALLEVNRENGIKKKKYCISKWEIIDSKQEFLFQSFLKYDIVSGNQFKEMNDEFRQTRCSSNGCHSGCCFACT